MCILLGLKEVTKCFNRSQFYIAFAPANSQLGDSLRTVGSTKIDVGPTHFKLSVAASGVDSNNAVVMGAEQKSTMRPKDESLLNELKRVNLEFLYDKFHGAGINYDIVWNLDDEMLQEAGLTKIEHLRYHNAKAKEYGMSEYLNNHMDMSKYI